jgi:hypothetical protein
MRTFHYWRDWLPAIHKTEYSVGVISILDVMRDSASSFIDNSDFQDQLVHFSSAGMKRRYLRGLRRKYANWNPDFVVWSEELWNFNSEMRNLGTHGGLRPITTRTVFSLWGGDKTGLPRGEMVQDVCTTLDIVPTLLQTLGVLDEQKRFIPQAGSNPEQVVLFPFPGHAFDLVAGKPAEARSDILLKTQP